MITTDCEFIQAQIDAGTMTDMLKAQVPSYPSSYPADFQFGGGAVPIVQMNPFGIGYNTRNVSKAEVPKSWDDLLDSRWTGKLLLVSPSSSPSQTQMWNYLIQSRGEDFARKLAVQAARFNSSTGPAAEALAAGEGDLLLPTAAQVTNTVAGVGAPVAYSVVQDTTSAYLCAGLSTNAPSPQSARLFLDFLLSRAGSEAINGDTSQGAVGPFGGAPMPSGNVDPAPVSAELTAHVAPTRPEGAGPYVHHVHLQSRAARALPPGSVAIIAVVALLVAYPFLRVVTGGGGSGRGHDGRHGGRQGLRHRRRAARRGRGRRRPRLATGAGPHDDERAAGGRGQLLAGPGGGVGVRGHAHGGRRLDGVR